MPATALPDGRVLVVGGAEVGSGQEPSPAAPAEVFDPATGTWQPAPAPTLDASYRVALQLADGTVLFAGGWSDWARNGSAVAERFDARSGAWLAAAPMSVARYYHAGVALPDGRVLMAGGTYIGGWRIGPISYDHQSTEAYDPLANVWAATGPMQAVRVGHALALLPGARLLAVGGQDEDDPSAEVLDLVAGTWRVVGSTSVHRLYGHTATPLPDGRIMVLGGSDQPDVEIFDPTTETWLTAGPGPPTED